MPKLGFYLLEGTITLGSNSVYVRNGEADVPEPFASELKRHGLAWNIPSPPPPPKPKEEKRGEEAEQKEPVTTVTAEKKPAAESPVRPKRTKGRRRKKVDKVKKVKISSKDSNMEVKQS